jgi:hypothetical protein
MSWRWLPQESRPRRQRVTRERSPKRCEQPRREMPRSTNARRTATTRTSRKAKSSQPCLLSLLFTFVPLCPGALAFLHVLAFVASGARSTSTASDTRESAQRPRTVEARKAPGHKGTKNGNSKDTKKTKPRSRACCPCFSPLCLCAPGLWLFSTSWRSLHQERGPPANSRSEKCSGAQTHEERQRQGHERNGNPPNRAWCPCFSPLCLCAQGFSGFGFSPRPGVRCIRSAVHVDSE